MTASPDAPAYRLGIDIGGTFTDLSLVDTVTGERTELKTPTVPAAPAQGVANGIAALAERGIEPSRLEYFVHGTTIALNALLQRSGARVALLVTDGFRDVLEQARVRIPIPYDFYSHRSAPLVPREFVVPVRERVTPAGVERELTATEVDRIVSVVRDLEVESVVIALLHSYRFPEHEQALEHALVEALPHLTVSTSSYVWPQMREYERTVVTVMNAYVQPVMTRYLADLERTLDRLGVTVRPYITRSNGGIMTVSAATSSPVDTLLSGPASGVVGAMNSAKAAGLGNLITFDMGGTSADVAVVEDGRAGLSREEQIGDLPVIIPAIGISSIGAGGGSIAWLDGSGVLKVGPSSAGADPGPACYGLGGKEPALSDAFLLSGYLNPATFSGGLSLDAGAAESALRPLAASLGLDVAQTASSVIEVALANMYTEISGVFERKGIDPREFTLVAFGGAGPVLACQLADEINIGQVFVPRSPGTLCALGALAADVMSDFVRSVSCPVADEAPAELATAVDELIERASVWLDHEAPAVAETTLRWSLECRYVGQSYEIDVPVEQPWLRDWRPELIRTAFHDEHERLFRHCDRDAAVEIVDVRTRAVGLMPDVPEQDAPCPAGHGAPGKRTVMIGGKSFEAAIHPRDRLTTELRVEGPAVVEQSDCTTVIPPGWTARTDEFGNLLVEKGAQA
ncbi:hydantoinase/oxoprolinase family protein [Actinoallomurus sp. NBC_01490]|uniref:hydantoinase/oxoprolinase family protein n=1 Tax=Actinoallomurus sp. NBC_01490 TaxID=2903557 RepID=UPI002E359937|nr:hydantoinase/oxoprolinase family protein [Actinoallomurus sp. NBC_01490]